MASKKSPEFAVTEGRIIAHSVTLQECRAQKAEIDKREKMAHDGIVAEATAIRDQKLDAKEVYGIIRAVPENQSPVITNFTCRTKVAGLTLNEAEEVRPLYGDAFPELYTLDTIVTGVSDFDGLLEAMTADGRRPSDFLELGVKPGCDAVVAEYSEYVTVDSAYIPRDGFLSKLSDVIHTLSEDALNTVKSYVKRVFLPVVKPSSAK